MAPCQDLCLHVGFILLIVILIIIVLSKITIKIKIMK